MTNRKIPLQKGVCIFFLFICLHCLYAAGHGKECVTEIVRVESTNSPLSAIAAPPQGTGVCENMF